MEEGINIEKESENQLKPQLPEPVTMIINGNSRRGQEAFPLAKQALCDAGVPLGKAILSKHKEETVRVLREEIERGARTVIVGGGDGTLSQCANVLAGSTVAMAVLPLGTGNTLARSLGIPFDIEEAAQTIARGHIETMNVGRVNGRVFLNSVTLGLSSDIAHALDGDIKKKWGVLSWVIVGGKVIFKHRALRLRVSAPEKQYRVRTHQLVISNGRYIAGPIAAGPDASVQDDVLRVFTLGRSTRWSLFKLTILWILGRHETSPEANYFATQKVRVHSLKKTLIADVDGELCEKTPLTIEIASHALRVVVPHDFEADEV